MKRKIVLTTIFLFLSFGLCINSFAAENMVNNIRNAVGGTENVLENGVKGIAGSITDMGNNISNSINNDNNDNNNGNDMMRAGNDNNYNATRTSTAQTQNNLTFGGMTSNMWTWLILAVVAVGIITIVWSYSSEDSKHE